MSYRLCVCDLDGTLLSSKNKISDADLRALLYLQNNGIPVTIATGRSQLQIREYVARLKVSVPIIGCNGGIICTPQDEQMLKVHYMPAKRAREISEYCAQYKLDYLMYTSKYVCYTPESRRIDGYRRYNAVMECNLRANKAFRVPLRSIAELPANGYDDVIKILVLGDTTMLGHIEDRFNSDSILTIVSSGHGLIDIMAESTSKGDAVLWLAKHLDISPNEVIVFGDSPNDESMFQVAGGRIAMGNAVDSIKKLASYITLSNDESGISHAIIKLFNYRT